MPPLFSGGNSFAGAISSLSPLRRRCPLAPPPCSPAFVTPSFRTNETVSRFSFLLLFSTCRRGFYFFAVDEKKVEVERRENNQKARFSLVLILGAIIFSGDERVKEREREFERDSDEREKKRQPKAAKKKSKRKKSYLQIILPPPPFSCGRAFARCRRAICKTKNRKENDAL